MTIAKRRLWSVQTRNEARPTAVVQGPLMHDARLSMRRSKPRNPVVVPIASRREDRRFICEVCGVKWYVPAERPSAPDPVRCEACGGALTVFVAPPDPPVG